MNQAETDTIQKIRRLGGWITCFLLLMLWVSTAALPVRADTGGTLNTSLNSTETTCTVTWSDYTMPSDGSVIKAAVWSASGGQDDIKWRNLKASGSSYSVSFKVSAHGDAGKYYVHLYLQTTGGSMVFLGDTTFNVSSASCTSVSVIQTDTAEDTCQVVIEGLTSPSGITKVQVPVWSKSNQSDIIWYNASLQSDGTWQAEIDFSRHSYNAGTYHIHVYATSTNKVFNYVGNTTAKYTVTSTDPEVTASLSGTSAALKASGVSTGGISRVQFAVWSAKNAQDDLKWTSASVSASGIASGTISLSDYRDFGTYYVHAYAVSTSGTMYFLGDTTFTVEAPSVESVETEVEDGSFTITISGVSCVTGVSKVMVPVWSRSNQSDIVWYTARQQSDGTYQVTSDISRHQNNTGTFHIHVYVYDSRGSSGVHAGSASMSFERTAGDLTMTADSTGTSYQASAADVSVPESYSGIYLAVWSAKDAQDDIVWYEMEQSGSSWSTEIPLSEHNYDSGTYHLHLYARQGTGTMLFIRNYTWDISLTDTIILTKTGETTASVSITPEGSYSRILFAVWCAAYNQSDIVWYEGTEQSGGSYTASIDTANHSAHSGTYIVHAYGVGSGGSMTMLDDASVALSGTVSTVEGTADITSCLITGGSQVTVTASVTGSGTFGLFVLEPGETELSSSDSPLATVQGSGTITLTAPLNADTSSSLLNEKLVIGQKSGSSYAKISDGAYITNPEAIASNTRAFPAGATKKGLQVNTELEEDAAELGVNYSLVNVTLNNIPAESGGISYVYNGKTWHMDMGYIYALDEIFSEQAANGSIVTAVLLMQWDEDWTNLILPSGREAGHSFYALNAETEEGREQLAAIFSFLADRYSTSAYNVVNWVLGNEVNNYTYYNWAGTTDLTTYASCYANAYRLLYNSVKSEYSNARVYISLDHVWNYYMSYAFKGQQLFNAFVAALDAEGSITWNIAFHPYPAPLTSANFWSNTTGVTNSSSSAFYTMLNLSSLTDYIRDTYGSEHRFILSEQGFTSVSSGTADEKLQAAAIAYGYYLAEYNDMVDCFILHRHVDHPAETATGPYFGLWNTNSTETDSPGTKKFAWTVYKYMDTSQGAAYTNFALSIIGADSWSSIVPGYSASDFS